MGKRGHGEGTITENEARGRWEGRVTTGYDAEGRQVRRKVTGATRAEVVGRIRELVAADDHGQDPAPAALTVRRFLEQWLTDVLPGSVAATTEDQYRNVVRLYIVPNIGQKRLRTLQAADVARMLRQLEAGGKSRNTQRLARSILRRSLRWAEAEGMVTRNVAALANGVKVGRSEGRTLTVKQARQLLATVAEDRNEAAFTVALSLGLRLGADLVFRTPFGTASDPKNFRSAAYRATEAAGIGRWSPHELRHSAASLLIAQDVPMKLVSELLGHSSIRITADVYGHLFDEAGAVTAAAMTSALWGEA